MLHLATGLGKTTSAVFDVIKFQEECAAGDPPIIPRILFVSHRNEISEQAQETFEYFLPEAQTAFFRTRQRDLPEADITFATFQSLHSQLNRFDPQDYEYIIYDEAHHSEAETFKAVREHFDPLFELALTATPDRLDELNIREYFGKPVYSKPLAEAIAESWLAEPDYHIVFDDAVREAMEGGFNPKTLGELKKLFMIKPRNEVIAKNVREERHKIGLDDAKTMVFCHSVEHADEMASLLGGVAYHSGIDRNERNRILRNFRRGSTQVICTVDMFNEGIDIPDAQLVVFLRSTQSPNIFEQQLGRGLRRAPGKERVSVLDFVANVERIAKVRELSQQVHSASGGGTGGGGTSGGLSVHTSHGDFDFDRLAVDLLEKYGRLTLDVEGAWKNASNEELIARALELQPDRPLSQGQLKELSRTKQFMSEAGLISRFGSKAAFNAKCGFVRKRPHNTGSGFKNWDNDDLVAEAVSLNQDTPLLSPDIEQLSKQGKFPSIPTIIKRFGSIPAFHRACGFDVVDVRNMTNEEAVQKALELSPDKPLTYAQLEALSKEGKMIGGRTVVKKFGDLDRFYEACGFKSENIEKSIAKKRQMTREDIVSLALQVSPNAPLEADDIRDLSKQKQFVSLRMIYSRFDSMDEFRKACGFD